MASEKLYRNTLNEGNRNNDNPCIYQNNNQVHSRSESEGESNGSSSENYF